MNCPKCNSEMWDNKPKKASGEFKSNSPDYKCRNASCGNVIWPPKTKTQTQPQTSVKFEQLMGALVEVNDKLDKILENQGRTNPDNIPF